MTWDPNKTLDEQPSRLVRWSPWALVLVVLVIAALAVIDPPAAALARLNA